MTTNYNWSYDKDNLYYHDTIVCHKLGGILICNYDFIDSLRPIFEEKEKLGYIFHDSLSNFEVIIHDALNGFYKCATNNIPIDEVLFTFVKGLHVTFDNKYLNYCLKLSTDQFREISEKHNKRQKNIVKQKVLDGIWYKYKSEVVGICDEAIPSSGI